MIVDAVCLNFLSRLGAASGAAEPFEEREMVYTIRSGSPGGMQGQQPAPLSLRIRKQGTESPSAKDSAATLADTFALGLPKTPWQMRYLGQPGILSSSLSPNISRLVTNSILFC